MSIKKVFNPSITSKRSASGTSESTGGKGASVMKVSNQDITSKRGTASKSDNVKRVGANVSSGASDPRKKF